MNPPKTHKLDERAQVGIGTMIVFIATILVAAVAAGVLIDTSQKLQDKSTQTGAEATSNVGTSLTVESVIGSRNSGTSDDNLEQLDIFLLLSPGADPVDLSELIIQYNNGDDLIVFKYVDGATSATEFNATWIRDSDSSGDSTVMTAGDYVKIRLGEAAAAPSYDVDLAESQVIDVNLVPPAGADVSVGFKAPPSFGRSKSVELF